MKQLYVLKKLLVCKFYSITKTNIPGCIYSRPQIASIGLTEVRAKEMQYDINVGRFPFIANGKAIAMENQMVLSKLLLIKTGEILGVHMIGAEVTEMIIVSQLLRQQN